MSKITRSYGSIDKVQTLLNQTINVNGKKLSCLVDPDSNDKTGNLFMLFYNNDNSTMHLGNHTEIGYFKTGIQLACRHESKQLSRTATYSAIKRLKTQKNSLAGVFISITTQPLEYGGIDETGNHIWFFNFNITSEE